MLPFIGKLSRQYFTVVLFVFQFYPVCNSVLSISFEVDVQNLKVGGGVRCESEGASLVGGLGKFEI